MIDWFYKDIQENVQKDWTELIADIKAVDTYSPYCISRSYYEIFKHLIVSLLWEKEIVLLDSDFSINEIEKLLGPIEIESNAESLREFNRPDFYSKDELIDLLKSTSKSWSITLFTSGTTGLPKKVKHTFETITRFVKANKKRSENVWGFAYNPTHMAGIQVFFQALLNGNQIVNLFSLSKDEICRSIDEFSITNISATPTFYRLLVPTYKSFPTITRITSGGEKIDENIIRHLNVAFPNAKITNVYASTEAGTLFASDGDVFSIKSEISHLIQIVNDEIIIHRSLMGETGTIIDQWYRTGDIIEVVCNNPLRFRFLSRKNDMINVGGYKVNPVEVEDVMRSIPGITDVLVFSKKNSVLGNIICCEIVSSNRTIEEQHIRSILRNKLQEFKIPRIIKFVDKLETTRTGKIKRNKK